MKLEFFPIPFVCGLGVLCIMLVILRRRKHSYPFLFFFSVFWVYLLVVVGMVLFPIPLLDPADGYLWRSSASRIISKINLIPFDYVRYVNVSRMYLFLRDVVANILLTMPFGFGISFLHPVRAKRVPALAILVGVGIETSQLIANLILGLSYRSVDINDTIMNAIGVMLGYAMFRLFSWIFIGYAGRHQVTHADLFVYITKICSQV